MNLDDNFDELTNNEFKEEEQKYTITPKGLLLISLFKSETFSKYFDLNSGDVMKITDETWAHFENYVRRNFGRGQNAGGVVFDVNNGEFYSISIHADGTDEVEPKHGDEDEDDD